MDWFFAESVDGEHLITGEDAIHITKSLRKSVGEAVTLCDSSGVEHNCLIDRINDEGVFVHEISKTECQNEPSVEVTLFAALTKGDKLETVIQKSVELGISHIVPVLTSRCVSRPDAKSAAKKQARYQKIALQAAMQSRRAIIPDVSEIITLEKASKMLSDFDVSATGWGIPWTLPWVRRWRLCRPAPPSIQRSVRSSFGSWCGSRSAPVPR